MRTRLPFGVCVLAMLLAHAHAHASGKDVCPTYGDFTDNPRGFSEQAARNMVVRLSGHFKSETREGVGFAIATVERKHVRVGPSGELVPDDLLCAPSEVIFVTALHNVMLEGTLEWASTVDIWVPGLGSQAFQAEIIQTQAAVQDVVLLRTTLSDTFVWTRPRYATSLKSNEPLKLATFQNGQLALLPASYIGPHTAQDTKLAVSAQIQEGDSGGPVFDSQWRLVGMITNSGARLGQGLVVPADTLELFLQSYGVSMNLMTAEQMSKAWQEKKQEREREAQEEAWGKSSQYMRFSVLSVGLIAPTLARFGMSTSLPLTHFAIVGVEFLAEWMVAGGARRKQAFGELGGEMGMGMYLWRQANIILSALWSPSLIVLEQSEARFVVALAGYKGRMEFGWSRLRLGIDVRHVSPPGNRESFTEFAGFLAWRQSAD